ncbi:MAG: hypothetical protein LBM95_08050 [Lactobacillales bacterium]|jgi:hypothetical protein|nr:hypothetical protein [Lactobacillales bacterium]
MADNELSLFNAQQLSKLKFSGSTLPKLFSQKIFLTKQLVAGTSHIENIEEIEEKLEIRTKILMFRETGNAVEELAIVLKTNDSVKEKIGYISQKITKYLHIYWTLERISLRNWMKKNGKEIG